MNLKKVYVHSVGALLLTASTAKIVSSFGNASILQTCDPVTGFHFLNLFRIVATIELIIALVCFFGKQSMLSVGLVAWLSSSFLAYRIFLKLAGYHRPCSCMGNLTDALHIPPQTADTAMKIILAYLLLGSYAALFWLWRQKRKQIVAPANSQLPPPKANSSAS